MSLAQDLQKSTTKEWTAFLSAHPGYTVEFTAEFVDFDTVWIDHEARTITLVSPAE